MNVLTPIGWRQTLQQKHSSWNCFPLNSYFFIPSTSTSAIFNFPDHISREGKAISSVRPSVRLSVCLLLHLQSGAKYCDDYVYLSVSLFVRPHISKTARLNFNFSCMFPAAVARSSTDGVAICCVHVGLLPVLRKTMGSTVHNYIGWILKQQQRTTRNYCINSNWMLLNDKDQQVHIVDCAMRAKSAIYDCLVCTLVIWTDWLLTFPPKKIAFLTV